MLLLCRPIVRHCHWAHIRYCVVLIKFSEQLLISAVLVYYSKWKKMCDWLTTHYPYSQAQYLVYRLATINCDQCKIFSVCQKDDSSLSSDGSYRYLCDQGLNFNSFRPACAVMDVARWQQ